MTTSKERVLSVLRGDIPDRVPWLENYISNAVAEGVLGTKNFTRATVTQSISKPGMIRIPPEIRNRIPLDNISYDMSPPRYANTKVLDGTEHVVEGLIKTPADLHYLDNLPDPDDESLYKDAELYLKEYKGESAAIACVRAGLSNTYLSMGIEHFCVSIMLDPEFVKEIMYRFGSWTIKVIKNLHSLPFDLFWMPDDIGFGDAPMISPAKFREICVPIMKQVYDSAKLPIIYHSDGNILPLMEDIIGFGVSGIANFEPGPMDIEQVKKDFGDRVTIVGNIDLHYTLTRGTPQETYEEVKQRIKVCGQGGRYILASANSLPPYVKPENVQAMGEALLEFGSYPLKF